MAAANVAGGGAFLFLSVTALPGLAMAQGGVPFTTKNPVAADPLTLELLNDFKAADLGEHARMALYLADARTGEMVLSIRADEAFAPASLLKVVTSAAALEELGPDHTFETRIIADGDVEKGILHGDLIIVGGGDPSLGPRFQKDRNDVTAVLRDWADAVRKAGITNVQGRVLGDDLRYSADPVGRGWEKSELGEWYSAEVSALCFNDNCLDIIWKASDKPGDRTHFTTVPSTTYAQISSSVRTGTATLERSKLRYYRFPDSREIRARGVIPPKQEKYDYASVPDPAAYTAHLFREELKREGIEVRGIAMSLRTLGTGDEETTNTRTIATHQSPPLSELLPVVNSISQNLYAEVLLRETSLSRGDGTTFEAATGSVQKWLRQVKLDAPGLVMVDGSGLSPIDRAPARLIARVLVFMRNTSPYWEVWHNSLAKPGEGSLRNRFEGDEYDGLREGLRAKTGFIDRVHSLGGYMENHVGKDYVFVMMMNDYDTEKSAEARDFIDTTLLKLYESPRLE